MLNGNFILVKYANENKFILDQSLQFTENTCQDASTLNSALTLNTLALSREGDINESNREIKIHTDYIQSLI